MFAEQVGFEELEQLVVDGQHLPPSSPPPPLPHTAGGGRENEGAREGTNGKGVSEQETKFGERSGSWCAVRSRCITSQTTVATAPAASAA